MTPVRATPAILIGSLLAFAAPRVDAEDPMKPHGKPAAPATRNRLAGERSPSLKQHQANPVDWWPWSPAAFAEAKRLDKPVFLSIGYAACHWCHVMAHESFEDPATAKVMNDVFVNVKVDREERPDVDDVYMAAIQLTTGHGGWPMSVYLLPDGRPFLARTYLRPQDVVATAARVAELWKSDRARLEGAAEEIADAIRTQSAGPKLPPYAGTDADLVKSAVAQSVASFDRERGGFDRRPKFPPHAHLLAFLDRDGAATGPEALEMARITLDGMALGGIHDHVGGGFHRYSTDAEWLVPHFEKMLYDNALLATAYARAAVVLKEPRYADVVRGVLGWVERDLAVAGGGYASSLDADTEGEEGLTYTWTPDEVRAALPDAGTRGPRARRLRRPGGGQLPRRGERQALRVAPSSTSAHRSRRPPPASAPARRPRTRPRARPHDPARRARAAPSPASTARCSPRGTASSSRPSRPRAPRCTSPACSTPAARSRASSSTTRARTGASCASRRPPDPRSSASSTTTSTWPTASSTSPKPPASRRGPTRRARSPTRSSRGSPTPPAASSPPATPTNASSRAARTPSTRRSPPGNATAARVLLRLAERTGLASYRTAADAHDRHLPRARRPRAGRHHGLRARRSPRAPRPRPATSVPDGRATPRDAKARWPSRSSSSAARRDPAAPCGCVLRVTLDPGWHVNPAGAATR